MRHVVDGRHGIAIRIAVSELSKPAASVAFRCSSNAASMTMHREDEPAPQQFRPVTALLAPCLQSSQHACRDPKPTFT